MRFDHQNIILEIPHFILAFKGNETSQDGQASGAYIFRPSSQTPLPISSSPDV